MIHEKLMEVLKKEGVVAIVTQGENEPHVVNTWNSYLRIAEDGSLFGPVGGMRTTETNLQKNNKVLVTLGSREVQGFHSMGSGCLIVGTAEIVNEGAEFDKVKLSYPWARATILIKPQSITQTL